MRLTGVLHEFLLTGRLANLGIGDTRDHVLRIMGSPDDSTSETALPVIWKYGPLQISIYEGRIVFLGIYISDQSSEIYKIMDESIITPMHLRELMELLSHDEVSIFQDLDRTYNDVTTLVIGAGVNVILRGQKFRVESLQYDGPPHRDRRLIPYERNKSARMID